MNEAKREASLRLTAPKTKVPVYEVRRVRLVEMREKCDHPDAAVVIAKRELCGLDREHVLAIYLNAQSAVMGFETVAIGFENGCGATLRTLFRGAILAGAKAIIVAHNHPSGDVLPSQEDRELLFAARAAGKVLGCPIIDFLIVADDGKHVGIDVVELGVQKNPVNDPQPLYTLIEAVQAAIAKYDRSRDHTRHEREETDCVRCKLVAVVGKASA